MIDRRRMHRFHLSVDVLGFLENDYIRHAGRVVNVSLGGMYLSIPEGTRSMFRYDGSLDYGEVHFGGTVVEGFGRVSFLQDIPQGVGVGFEWDDSVLLGQWDKINKMIQALIGSKSAGGVCVHDNVVLAKGHFSNLVSEDCHAAAIRGARLLNMSDVSSIDDSGMELLSSLKDRGVSIVQCNTLINSALRC